MARLLVVEDDQRIGDALASALTADAHHVRWCRTGQAAIDAAAGEPYDLVLLDLGLPDVDGLRVCRQVRAAQPGSVIVILTARQEEMDVVVGLESGADDYLTKPFTLVVLLARVRAHLRRGASVGAPSRPIRLGDLEVDAGARRCLLAGVEVALRAKEFDLLERLARAPGVAVSREILMADVWDENWFGSTKTLDVHVATLRRRLIEGADRVGRQVVLPTITTLRGYGYRLDPPP